MPLTPHDLVPAEDPRAPGAVARRVRERIAVTQRELRASQTSLREQFRQLEEQAGELEVLAEEILTRNAELERFTVWLERLREAAAAVASRRGTRGVLAAACRHARELLEARVVVAALADADDLRWYGARGSVSPRERRLPRFDAACRRVLETGLSVVVEGAAAGVHTVAVAPIRAGTGVVGVLVCGWETELPPSLAQVRLAETLGAQVGVALGRERTRGRDRRTRRARERFLSALGGELARPAEELSSLAGRLERADAAERARIVLRMEALAREIAEVASDLRSPGEERSPDTAIPLREVLEDALLAVGPRAQGVRASRAAPGGALHPRVAPAPGDGRRALRAPALRGDPHPRGDGGDGAGERGRGGGGRGGLPRRPFPGAPGAPPSAGTPRGGLALPG